MTLLQCFLTKNRCYQTGALMKPRGVMVHSTAANNPTLRRYVQPDVGGIGVNRYGNHWNRPDVNKCVHAFIGTLADGSVATVQTLPWNCRGWHAGSGAKGSANDGYISFEICEDGLKDGGYFEKIYREAVELTAYLCKAYSLDPCCSGTVICHKEGYRMGIASNHGDVEHWFPKFGRTMDDFRRDVASAMKKAAPKTDFAKSFDGGYARTWTVTAAAGLNLRRGASTDKAVITALKQGTKFRCYGYYTKAGDRVWLYGTANGRTGFCVRDYLA